MAGRRRPIAGPAGDGNKDIKIPLYPHLNPTRQRIVPIWTRSCRPISRCASSPSRGSCTRCPLYRDATQACRRGPSRAAFMLVGEQPGDKEDSPASRSSARPAACSTRRCRCRHRRATKPSSPTRSSISSMKCAANAGCTSGRTITRSNAARSGSTTNANCVKPSAIVALGVTAARSLTGKTVTISEFRGKRSSLADGTGCSSPCIRRRCCASRTSTTSGTPIGISSADLKARPLQIREYAKIARCAINRSRRSARR